MTKSIREIIAVKLTELQNIDAVGPGRASEILVELSALLGSINTEVSDREFLFNLRKLEFLKESGIVGKATIESNATNEFKQFKEAVAYQKAVIESMRAIKYYLRRADEAQRESVY